MLNSSGLGGNSHISRPATIQGSPSLWSGSRPSKGMVPTAKVPTYLNRVRQGVRDTRPGLLPTPDMPPMRPANMVPEFGMTEGNFARRGMGYGSSTPYDDVYATPYATHLNIEYQRTRSTTSNCNSAYSECAIDTPSSAGTILAASSIDKAQISTQPGTGNGTNDDDLIGSLLTLLIESEKAQPSSVSQTPQNAVSAELMASIAGFYLPSSNLDNYTQ